MRKLYIIGARGCGREVYNFFQELKEQLKNCKDNYLNDVECAGFLDDKSNALEGFIGYPPVVCSVEEYQPGDNDVFICALGDPKWVRHYTGIIESKNGNFISLISPYASIGKNTKIGDGSIIPGWTAISCDVLLGRHTYVGVFCDLGHDVRVGDCCHIGAYTFIGGGAYLGNCVTSHPRVNILPHKKIGDNAVLGAASVVIRNVKADTTVFGVPAKTI